MDWRQTTYLQIAKQILFEDKFQAEGNPERNCDKN